MKNDVKIKEKNTFLKSPMQDKNISPLRYDKKEKECNSMNYVVADNTYPLQFISCGNLISQNNFVHLRRITEDFVFIFVKEGTLFITQGKQKYALSTNQTLLLIPGIEHFGHKPCEGYLSYYWVHFKITNSNYQIYTESELKKKIELWDANPSITHTLKNYIIPEVSKLISDTRVTLLFVQMLDFAKRDNFSITHRMHYSLSLLMIEFSEEAFGQSYKFKEELPVNLTEIIEWICANYEQDITVASLSEQFGYNPNYLSSLFKKFTGYSIIPYINHFRISVSKNLLVNRNLKIYTIAKMCGFQDEKHFMKIFKRYESITPSQYRISFYQKKIN